MNNRQNGQVGLVVLLIASVLLTLGIGVASQSVLQTKTATQETDSSSIFNVTERAIEEALKSLMAPSDENDEMKVTVTGVTTNYQVDVSEGDVAQLVLDGGTIDTISWKVPNDGNCGAAIIVSVIGGLSGENVTRYAYDKEGCPGIRGNGFSEVTCAAGLCTTPAGLITGPNPTKISRIKVVYADTTLTASLIGAPEQAKEISAQGTDKVTGETRAINTIRSVPSVPVIFDYALFSGLGDIAKN